VLLQGVYSSSPRLRAVGYPWRRGRNFLLHHQIFRSFDAVLDDSHHHAKRGDKQKTSSLAPYLARQMSEGKSLRPGGGLHPP
jgi:hypothetical protein